jgi:hypothetical protein
MDKSQKKHTPQSTRTEEVNPIDSKTPLKIDQIINPTQGQITKPKHDKDLAKVLLGKMYGKEPIFKTAEELDDKINKYFTEGIRETTRIIGKGDNKEVVTEKIPTVTGLALYLGFHSRQSIYDYKANKNYTYIIKRAISLIEEHHEARMSGNNVIGSIFWLKNHGWKDKQEIDQGISDELAQLMKEISGNGTAIPIQGQSGKPLLEAKQPVLDH